MGTDLATSIYGSLSADAIPESDPASSKPTEESEPTPNKTKEKQAKIFTLMYIDEEQH